MGVFSFSALEVEDRLYQSLEESRGEGVIHPDESLRAVAALSGAALSVVAEELSRAAGSLARRVCGSGPQVAGGYHRADGAGRARILRGVSAAPGTRVQRRGAPPDRAASSTTGSRTRWRSRTRTSNSTDILKDRDPEAAVAKIEGAQEITKEALRSTRDLSYALHRPEAGDGMYPGPLGLHGNHPAPRKSLPA